MMWLRGVVFLSLVGGGARAVHPDDEDVGECQAQVEFVRPVLLLAGMLGRLGSRGDDVPATLALFRMPHAIVLDTATDELYVSDASNHVVRLISQTSQRIFTVIGKIGEGGATGDGGLAIDAKLREPHGLEIDAAARLLFVADQGNHAVRLLDIPSGNISTVAGVLGVAGSIGPADGTADIGPALLQRPAGLALATAEQRLYVADAGNGAIRVLDLVTLRLSTVETIGIHSPAGLAVDVVHHRLYVADKDRHVIWRVDLDPATGLSDPNATGLVRVAGLLDEPDDVGTNVYDNWNSQRHVNLEVGVEAIEAGRGFAKLGLPGYRDGEIYGFRQRWENGELVAVPHVEQGAMLLGLESPAPGPARTAEHGGSWTIPPQARLERALPARYHLPAIELPLRRPHDVTLDVVGQRLYVTDEAAPAVRMVNLRNGNMSRALALSGYYGPHKGPFDVGPVGVYVDKANISGFEVAHIEYTFNKKSTFGKYFYFDATVLPFSTGIHTVQQYRNQVMIWRGHVEFRDGLKFIGPTGNGKEDCPVCTNHGFRYPLNEAAAEGQFELGDLLHIQTMHPQATQRIFTAEAKNYAVRYADVANPFAGLLCSRDELPQPLYSNYFKF